jgi:hypothetical protein
MRELHEPRLLVTAHRDGNPAAALSRPYRWAGDGDRVESPAEITGRLHAVIAAKSPEHAALVAAFEARHA